MVQASHSGVRYETRNDIGWVTLDRPHVHNALNPEMLRELLRVLEQACTDDTIAALIVTGAGDQAFSAGADINLLSTATPLQVREFARLAVAVNARIEGLGKVVVAALNGSALGGGLELAEACTLRLVVAHAQLGHPEVRIGALAGFGGTTRLPRLVGKGRATEILLTGRLVGAEEALRIGLVNRIVPRETLLDEAETLVREILLNAPIAVKMTSEAIHRGLNLTLEESALLGAEYFGLVASTEDFRSGTKAFLEKREALFAGK